MVSVFAVQVVEITLLIKGVLLNHLHLWAHIVAQIEQVSDREVWLNKLAQMKNTWVQVTTCRQKNIVQD